MINPQMFTRKTDEVALRSHQFVRRTMDTFVDEVQLNKVDEDDQMEVYELFGCTILKGVIGELFQYFPADDIRNTLAELGMPLYDAAPYSEGVKNNKPSLREAQNRVALIAGKQKMNENLESSMCNDAKEKFCILFDWEYQPEDIKCFIIDDVDMIFRITVKDGTKYTYDLKNDCIR